MGLFRNEDLEHQYLEHQYRYNQRILQRYRGARSGCSCNVYPMSRCAVNLDLARLSGGGLFWFLGYSQIKVQISNHCEQCNGEAWRYECENVEASGKVYAHWNLSGLFAKYVPLSAASGFPFYEPRFIAWFFMTILIFKHPVCVYI